VGICPGSVNIPTGNVTSATTDVASTGDVYAPVTTLPSIRGENDVVTTQNTTHFIDGGTKMVAQPETTSIGTRNDRAKNLVLSGQTLVDFFSKPHILGAFTFSKTDDQNVHLAHYDLLDDIFTANPVLLSRLDYFYGFRGDVVLRVQANPSMAQSGKVLFVYEPFYKRLGTTHYGPREEHLTSLTQLPKVEFDLGTDRTAEFRIPCRFPQAFQILPVHGFQDYGRLVPVVYAKLRGGTTNAVDFTVWVWFEPSTVVLANPTTNEYSSTGFTRTPAIFKTVKPQSAVPKAEQQSNTKPASQVLGAVSTVARTVAMVPIPGVQEAVTTVAWAAGIAKGVATSLGWSNPRQELAPSLMIVRDSRDLCTTDQAVPGYVYAFSASSRVGPERAGGLVEEDELHFGHLLPISTYRELITWDDTDEPGHTLIDCEAVRPLLGSHNGATYHHSAPWTAIINMFKYWRGHIRFTFKIAKTRFHSGRLIVAFDSDPLVSTFTMAQSEVLNRIIIDLESGNEWTFECPFPQNTDYVDSTKSVGRLSMFVLTPLSYAGGASDTIDIIIETSMRADASFHFPMGLANQATPPEAERLLRLKNKKKVVKQSRLPSSSSAPIQLTNNVLVPFSDPVDREAACVGDTCRSLRTMIKRGPLYVVEDAPEAIDIPANSIASLGSVNPIMRYVMLWYALYRGSMRYTIRPQDNVYLSLREPKRSNETGSDTGYVQFLPVDVVSDLEVPQHAVNPWRYVSFNDTNDSTFWFPKIKSLSTVKYEMMATAADDFDLSFFIGVWPYEL
jgi:hypothetical protein